MKAKKIIGLIAGVLFSLSLFVMWYVFFVLSVAFSLSKTSGADLFAILIFGLFPMGILALVGSILIFKNIKLTKVFLIISITFYIICCIFALLLGGVNLNTILFMLPSLFLGIVAVVFSFVIKMNEIKNNKKNFKKQLNLEDKTDVDVV